MLDLETDHPWRGRPVVLYDRCVVPDDILLGERQDGCRRFAVAERCSVAGEFVDYGRSATIDGRGRGGWLDVAAGRPQLRAAVRHVLDTDAWLLVWHPDRISAYAACRTQVFERVAGRVLRAGVGPVVSGLPSASVGGAA